jgi:alpha-tubulin suppressor-like RCC1 family protein
MVSGLSNTVALSAAGGRVLALAKDGRVFSWRSNFCGALGRPPRQELPIDTVGEIPGLAGITAIAAGAGVSTALKNDGTVRV